MAEQQEGGVKRLIRFMALGVPMLSRVLAVALVIAAISIAFFNFGDLPNDGARANLALLLALLALVSLAVGFIVPAIVSRVLPKR